MQKKIEITLILGNYIEILTLYFIFCYIYFIPTNVFHSEPGRLHQSFKLIFYFIILLYKNFHSELGRLHRLLAAEEREHRRADKRDTRGVRETRRRGRLHQHQVHDPHLRVLHAQLALSLLS